MNDAGLFFYLHVKLLICIIVINTTHNLFFHVHASSLRVGADQILMPDYKRRKSGVCQYLRMPAMKSCRSLGACVVICS
jgi:hypothetical protein